MKEIPVGILRTNIGHDLDSLSDDEPTLIATRFGKKCLVLSLHPPEHKPALLITCAVNVFISNQLTRVLRAVSKWDEVFAYKRPLDDRKVFFFQYKE